jgi:hypothetical protein
MHHHSSKAAASIVASMLCGIFLFSAVAQAESYPQFSQQYWEDERDRAEGKIVRGAVIGALGVVTIAPSTIWAMMAVNHPEKFLANSLISGIAALSLTFYGFFSIHYGGEQRDRAESFINQYKVNPSGVSLDEEQAYYLDTEKSAARKMIIFGSMLGLQGSILLANGIVLSIRKHKGRSIGDSRIWPSFLLGGLLVGSGGAVIAAEAVRYKQLGDLKNQPPPTGNALLIRPYFTVHPFTSALEGGLIGQFAF